MAQTSLIEPSLADAIDAVKSATALSAQRRSHWVCSLHKIATMLEKTTERSPDMLPARWTALRHFVSRLHPASCGVTAKTLANHKSNARAALVWLAGVADIPSRGAPLSPDWAWLRNRISDLRSRALLSSPMRFWSVDGIRPEDVDEGAVDACLRYRAETTALPSDDAARRAIARAWNRCRDTVEGWPAHKLDEPSPKRRAGVGWDALDENLRSELDAYFSSLTKIRRTASGKRVRPCKPRTIQLRRARILAYLAKAVALGVPLHTLVSLRDVLSPELVERVLDSYWNERGETPSVYLIDLAGMLVDVAKRMNCLDDAALARLQEMRADVEDHRTTGMTPKNMALVRQVLAPGVWRRVVALPAQLMQEARECRDRSPVKAAVLAQMACAIAILTVAPVRLANLVAITLERNLVRPGGPDTPLWLVFPQHDVKNRVRLEFPLDEDMTALIDQYLRDYLPTLRRGSNQLCIFPGMSSAQKGSHTLSEQITERIKRATGLQVTVHQFRHAAAAIILREYTGNYELVRRILGHKNIQTTINFYVGLETTQAARLFGEIVHRELEFRPEG